MAVKSHIISGFTIPLKPTASSSSSGNSSTLCLVKKPLTSSFFNGGVASLKLTRLRSVPGRSHCYRQRGGALGTRMNLFDRFARVVKSYANALLSSFEDPEKILDQAVLEMNDDLVKMRQATAQVLASQKRLENKYKAAQQASEDWYRKAQLALQKGEEDLAREALKRRKSFADNANSLKAQLDQQQTVVDNLVSNTRLLESKIQEAKSKKDTLKARAQSAKTATKRIFLVVLDATRHFSFLKLRPCFAVGKPDKTLLGERQKTQGTRMFGVVFPNRSFPMDISSFTQIDTFHWVLDMNTFVGESYHQIGDMCIFLLNNFTLPPDKALAVYVQSPGSPFVFCGAVTLQRPSAVLSLIWPEPGGQMQLTAPDSAAPSAKIGVSVEDLVALPSLDVAAEKKIERMALKVGENLFNFMQSFCGVDGSKLVVPMDILDRWFKKFQEKAKRDSDFLKGFAV